MKTIILKSLTSLLLTTMAITYCSNANGQTTGMSYVRESAITSENSVKLAQMQDVDKSKCNEDHICYNRIEVAYNALFGEIEEGMSEFVSGNSFDSLSEELQKLVKKTWDTQGCIYPEFDISTGESFKGGYNEYKLPGGDWSTNFIASLNWDREKIYQAALQKHPIRVSFAYTVTTFYDNHRCSRRGGQVQVVMIYENNDWFIDNIIYANKQTLRNTLKDILTTSESKNSYDNIIGTWEGSSNIYGITMREMLVFRSDGTGMYKVNNMSMPFTWEIKDSSIIEVQTSEDKQVLKIVDEHIIDISANGSHGTSFYKK